LITFVHLAIYTCSFVPVHSPINIANMVAWKKLDGMLAATLTPMHADGSINYDLIGPYIDHLVKNGVRQIYRMCADSAACAP
jgi:hypothetical protein